MTRSSQREQTAGEPVAWRYRRKHDGGGKWTLSEMAPGTGQNDDAYEFQSLYAAPVEQAGSPEGPHADTADLVDRFAAALKAKLAAAEEKYGYGTGWMDTDWLDECRANLREHVEKGDPRDVAAYCAFLWHHGESTKMPEQAGSPPLVNPTQPSDEEKP